MGSAVNAPTSSANAWLRRSRRRWTQSRALCCRRRGPPRKLARPPLGSGRRPRTFGVPDLPPRGPEGEGVRGLASGDHIGGIRTRADTQRAPPRQPIPAPPPAPWRCAGQAASRPAGRGGGYRRAWSTNSATPCAARRITRWRSRFSAATRRSARRRRRHQPLCWAQLGCCGGVHGLDIRSCLAVREWMKGCLMAGKRSLEG